MTLGAPDGTSSNLFAIKHGGRAALKPKAKDLQF